MSHLSEALASSEFAITSELTPPKGVNLDSLLEKAALLKPHVCAINLTESHAARMAMDPVAVGHLLLDHGVEPIVQMTARDKNRLAIQASILGAAALGISNIVFMGGDPPKNGDHPDAKPVFDLFASQLLEAAHTLNNGTDLTGNELNASRNFSPALWQIPVQVILMRRSTICTARSMPERNSFRLRQFMMSRPMQRFLTKPAPPGRCWPASSRSNR